MKKLFLIIPLVVLLAAGCNNPPTTAPLPVTPTNQTQSATNHGDWKTYTNTKYGFEFKYPKTWNQDSIEIRTPLDGSKFENPPAGTSYTYNVKTASWTDRDFPSAKVTELKEMNSPNIPKWYLTGIADGLGGSEIALIPSPKNNIMIHIFIGWAVCDDESDKCKKSDPDPMTTANKDLKDMISTFKFTK